MPHTGINIVSLLVRTLCQPPFSAFLYELYEISTSLLKTPFASHLCFLPFPFPLQNLLPSAPTLNTYSKRKMISWPGLSVTGYMRTVLWWDHAVTTILSKLILPYRHTMQFLPVLSQNLDHELDERGLTPRPVSCECFVMEIHANNRNLRQP